jgi:glutaredoxin 3
MAEVELYTIQYCPFCVAAKDLLRRKGVEFVDHDLSDLSDADLRKKTLEISGRTTVPQIWINGQHVGGYTDLDALERSGQLDRMLDG